MDIRQTITDNIIALLEHRTPQQVRARWAQAGRLGLPRNGATGAAYRGVNILILMEAAVARGFDSPVWLTYRQASALGAQVRKGEKSTLCCYFEMVGQRAGAADADADAGADVAHCYPLCKPFWLFNAAQIDALPAALAGRDAVRAIDPIPAADQLIAASGATVVHGHAHAAFLAHADRIEMPRRERLVSPPAYYATLLHELIHWTGHPSRLARAFGHRFGDHAYAFEELVAELGAAFLGGHLGFVDAMLEEHADYLASWIRVLKNDKTAIFTASKHACLAWDSLLARAALDTSH